MKKRGSNELRVGRAGRHATTRPPSHPKKEIRLVYITLIIRRRLVGSSEGNSFISRPMRSAIWGLLLVLAACPSEVQKPIELDAGPPLVEVIDAGPVDAGPPIPSSLEPTVAAGFPDGGSVAVTAKAEIEPATSLTVSLPIKLKDFRIRLIDFREQIVTSDDELLADGRTYLINLPEPLKTGRGYTVVLDSELGPIVTDETGGTWNDWELAFRIAGDVQPEPGAKKKPPKKKKK